MTQYHLHVGGQAQVRLKYPYTSFILLLKALQAVEGGDALHGPHAVGNDLGFRQNLQSGQLPLWRLLFLDSLLLRLRGLEPERCLRLIRLGGGILCCGAVCLRCQSSLRAAIGQQYAQQSREQQNYQSQQQPGEWLYVGPFRHRAPPGNKHY